MSTNTLKIASIFNLKTLWLAFLWSSACTPKINLTTIPYDNQLKKVLLEAIAFNSLSLKHIPAPYDKDNSGQTDPAYRNYKTSSKAMMSWIMGFDPENKTRCTSKIEYQLSLKIPKMRTKRTAD